MTIIDAEVPTITELWSKGKELQNNQISTEKIINTRIFKMLHEIVTT